MVSKKGSEKTIMESLKEMSEDYDRRAPVIGKEWTVEEVTPGYNTGGYYDQDIPEERVTVAKGFKSRQDAQEWLEQHEPDKGKTLEIAYFELRRHTYEQWHRSFK